MPNDDGLKEFMGASPHLSVLMRRDMADKIYHWLSELLTAREYIPALQAEAERAKQLQEKITAMEHGMKFYIDRNIELADQYQDMKKSLECWVTRAGVLEAKLREKESDLLEIQESERYLTNRIMELIPQINNKDELLWWLTAGAFNSWFDVDTGAEHFTRMCPLTVAIIRQILATQNYTREELERQSK